MLISFLTLILSFCIGILSGLFFRKSSAPGKFPPERAAFWETLRREGLKAAL